MTFKFYWLKFVKRMRMPLILLLLFAGILWPGSGCKREPSTGSDHEHGKIALPSSVELSPEALKTAGVVFESARLIPFSQQLKFPAEITFNLRNYINLTARVSGRVEQLSAFQGESVKTGQILLFLYSPDYLSLQAELLQAAKRAKLSFKNEAEAESVRAMLESSRKRLKVLGLTDKDLEQVESTGVVEPYLKVKAPFEANVVECNVAAGDYVEMGTSLLKLADLRSVWVEINIFESALKDIRKGDEILVKLASYPGEVFSGRVEVIGSQMDRATRTVKCRAEVKNKNGLLKPGMFVEVEFVKTDAEERLAVPSSAVHSIDGRIVVFVHSGQGKFEVRDVITGKTADGYVEITSGLEEGSQVAGRGSFLIKSELLKATIAEEGHKHD